MNKMEIMAPVGSYESLMAAIQAGADSVYFGVGNLNMRSRSANNFSLDDMERIADIARQHGVRTYLTVNTIIYDNEMDDMRAIVDKAREVGISAIIASDFAVMEYARSKSVEIHASTQCNISNFEAVRYYSRFADVVVTARELSLRQVADITKAIAEHDIRGPKGELLQIEVFAHGALCMSVSGKCYLSLDNYNYSANRGACLQLCRREYLVKDLESDTELVIDNKYIMSPKDLKTIHFLNKMVDAGVTVFKIEGRARGPEYVRTVAGCYDEALQAICDGTYTEERINEWTERLAKVFNRGFWDGYYMGQRLGEWSAKYGSSATRVKKYVAKGIRYYSKLGVAEFLMEAGELHVGDEAWIIGPTTGAIPLTVEEIRVDLKPVEKTVKGEHFSIAVPEKIRPSDKLYLWQPVPPRES